MGHNDFTCMAFTAHLKDNSFDCINQFKIQNQFKRMDGRFLVHVTDHTGEKQPS